MARERNLFREESPQAELPHYHGHRQRLRARFLESGEGALSDYELLELTLFRAIPRRDVKPLAKDLLKRFGSFAETVTAPPERLREIEGLGEAAIVELKIVEAAALRLGREQIRLRKTMNSFHDVIEYCRAAMAYSDREEFRILFLDKKNGLIADEIVSVGTVDHTPVYPREIVKRALELGASGLLLTHNHPSGDATPSKADIRMTEELAGIASLMGIVVVDHLIIARNSHTSFKGLRLL